VKIGEGLCPSDIQILKYVHLTNKNVSKVNILNLHFYICVVPKGEQIRALNYNAEVSSIAY